MPQATARADVCSAHQVATATASTMGSISSYTVVVGSALSLAGDANRNYLASDVVGMTTETVTYDVYSVYVHADGNFKMKRSTTNFLLINQQNQ